MNLFEAIKERYSYRGDYQNITVSREDLTKILQAGLDAPSGGNAQTTSLIGIDDPSILKSIAAIITKKGLETLSAGIIVLAKAKPVFRDISFAVQDYSAAIENILLAISALGYVSCWIEGEVTYSEERQKAIRELLKIPDEYKVVCYLPIGKPVNPGKRADKKPFGERAFFNYFGG